MRAAIIQVPIAPRLEERIAGPPALHLDLDTGDGARAGRDQQIPEAALELPGQRSLGDLDYLAAVGAGFEKKGAARISEADRPRENTQRLRNQESRRRARSSFGQNMLPR